MTVFHQYRVHGSSVFPRAELLIIKPAAFFAMMNNMRTPLQFEKQIVIHHEVVDNTKTVDGRPARILLDHNRDGFAPSMKSNSRLYGNVHESNLHMQLWIRALLVVSETTKGLGGRDAFLSFRDSLNKVLGCDITGDIAFVATFRQNHKGSEKIVEQMIIGCPFGRNLILE